jgi:hypothetical protein
MENIVIPQLVLSITASQDRLSTFYATYLKHLTNMVNNNPDYAYTKARCTDIPELAAKMLAGLLKGSANKDGEAIKLTCKELKIPHTYKAIKAYVEYQE